MSNKPSTSLKSVTLISVTAAATALAIQACGGGAQADTAADPFEGVWQSVISARDCTSNAVVFQFVGQSVIHRGGTMGANSNHPPTSGTSAFGVWQRSGSGYTTNMLFIRFNADGTPAGTQTVTRALTLGADGKTFTATITNRMLDTAGAVVAQGCATETGQRVTW